MFAKGVVMKLRHLSNWLVVHGHDIILLSPVAKQCLVSDIFPIFISIHYFRNIDKIFQFLFIFVTEFSDTAVWFFFSVCVATLVMGILVFSGIVLLPALLPVAGTDHALVDASKNNKTAGNFTSIDKLAMGNVKVSFLVIMNYLLFCFYRMHILLL